MTHSTPKRRAWRVAAVATAGALVAALGFAAPASAAPIITDPDATGTLIVHKRLNPVGTLTPGNGLPNPSAPGTPLNGIEFNVQKIENIDLLTQAGWEATNAAIAALPTAPAPLGAVVSETTANNPEGNGTAVFEDLEIGAYYVTEVLTPAQISSGITPAAPFIVTVPITDPTNLDNWLYVNHVYPKNLQTTPEKTVNDGPGTTYEIGDEIEYTVAAPVPTQDTTRYAFKDVLVEHLVIPGADAAEIAANISVAINSVDLLPADYTIYYPATLANLQVIDPSATVAPAANTLLVNLTASGLDKLKAAAAGQQIALTFTTEVVSLPNDGIIENEAAVFPNDGFPIEGPGVPTPEVESKFGEINIVKTDAETGALLAGAEFRVFKSQAHAEAFAADPAANSDLPLSAYENGINNGSLVSLFTTGANGEVSISGLRASNWQDGAELLNQADWQEYWLLEVKAPTGYELLTAPVGPVFIEYDATAPTVLPHGDADIENVKKPEIPLTGGTVATWLFFIVGGLVLAGGALLVVRARRQNA